MMRPMQHLTAKRYNARASGDLSRPSASPRGSIFQNFVARTVFSKSIKARALLDSTYLDAPADVRADGSLMFFIIAFCCCTEATSHFLGIALFSGLAPNLGMTATLCAPHTPFPAPPSPLGGCIAELPHNPRFSPDHVLFLYVTPRKPVALCAYFYRARRVAPGLDVEMIVSILDGH